MNVKEELLEILEELHPDIDFAEEEQLIDDKLLDSFDVVTLVTEIGSAFDVELTAADMVPENFNTVDAMFAIIDRMMED